MSKKAFNVSQTQLRDLGKERERSREEHFEALIPSMGEGAIEEMRKIYRLFDERMLIWYAGLWDCERGAFYFSEDARDTEGFYPDIESTAQAVKLSDICLLRSA